MDSATELASPEAATIRLLGGDLAGDPAVEPEQRAGALSPRFAGADAQTLLRLALTLYGGKIALVSSFGAESAVLLHMVSEIDRDAR